MTLAPTGPRDVRNARRLAELEVIIDRGMASFVEVGEALLEVRGSKLYQVEYETFEAYLKGRWNLTRTRGYQLMEAAGVSKVLDIPVESQARAIAPVLRDHGPEVAAEVMAEASANGAPTAEKVRAAAAPFRPRLDPSPDPYFTKRVLRTVTTEVIEEAPLAEPDTHLWDALVGVMDAIEALSVSDAPIVAATVPDRRRAASAKRLRKLGTYLGRIAWSLESEGEPE